MQRLDCSNKPIRKVSPASCKAIITVDCNHKSSLIFWIISLTTLWKGNLRISNSILLWYFLISHNAFKPLLVLFIFSSSSLSTLTFPPFSFFSTFIFCALLSFSFLKCSLSVQVGILFTLHAISANKTNAS